MEVKNKLNELSENFENNSQEKKDKDSRIRELESQVKILQNQADKDEDKLREKNPEIVNERPIRKEVVTQVKEREAKGKQKEIPENKNKKQERKFGKNHNSEKKEISDSLKIEKEELKELIKRTRGLNQKEKEILKNLINRGKLSKKQQNFDKFQTLLKKLAIRNQRKVVNFLLKGEKKDSRNYKKLSSELQSIRNKEREIRKQQELQARIEVQNRCVIS